MNSRPHTVRKYKLNFYYLTKMKRYKVQLGWNFYPMGLGMPEMTKTVEVEANDPIQAEEKAYDKVAKELVEDADLTVVGTPEEVIIPNKRFTVVKETKIGTEVIDEKKLGTFDTYAEARDLTAELILNTRLIQEDGSVVHYDIR